MSKFQQITEILYQKNLEESGEIVLPELIEKWTMYFYVHSSFTKKEFFEDEVSSTNMIEKDSLNFIWKQWYELNNLNKFQILAIAVQKINRKTAEILIKKKRAFQGGEMFLFFAGILSGCNEKLF